MSEERQFLQAIDAQPEDRTVRLVYADWLEEQGDARGELVRIEEEMRTIPIYSDRYWELKPRCKQLRRSAKRPWLQRMRYGVDYEPVFGEVPDGWKERWRLLREFTERWYQIPMDNVGGPLKKSPRQPRQQRGIDHTTGQQIESVENAPIDPQVLAGLPPSLREWIFFIRDLQIGLKDFGRGSGDNHIFCDSGEQICFLQLDGCREHCFVRNAHRHDLDPPVGWDWASPIEAESSRSVAHVTTLALHYLMTQYEPESGEGPARQRMTKKLARQLAAFFPVRSYFDDTQIFERPNVIALLIPNSFFTGDHSCLQVKVRKPANPDEVHALLWNWK